MFNRKEYMKKYRQTEKCKKYHRNYQKKWNEKNPEKRKQIMKRNRLKYKDEKRDYLREWRNLNRETYRRLQRKGGKKYYPKNKHKVFIRTYTLRKYGKLPKGWQYHHITNPYHIDYWLGVHKEEHKRIFDKKQ